MIFKININDDDEAFKKSIGELERLSCLAHDHDHSNHTLCTA